MQRSGKLKLKFININRLTHSIALWAYTQSVSQELLVGMSYRSKRTMGAKKEDVAQNQAKNSIQPSKIQCSLSTDLPPSQTDGRWGPFAPPASQTSSKLRKPEAAKQQPSTDLPPSQTDGRWGPFIPPTSQTSSKPRKSEASKQQPNSNLPPSQTDGIWKQPPLGLSQANNAGPNLQPSQRKKSEIIWKRPLTRTSGASKANTNSEVPSKKRVVNEAALVGASPPPQSTSEILGKRSLVGASLPSQSSNTADVPPFKKRGAAEVVSKGPVSGSKTTALSWESDDLEFLNELNIPPFINSGLTKADPPTKPSEPAQFTSTSEAFTSTSKADPIEKSNLEQPEKDRITKKHTPASKVKTKVILPEWNATVEYDDKEEVLTIDPDGKQTLISGPIHPVDVWNNNGVKYYVRFNDLCQPIRKGGHVLVRFIGSIAKLERYCPVGERNWHQIDKSYKTDIINEIRARFVIPNCEIYDDQALKRVDKSWRQYRYSLRSLYFKPEEKSVEEHYTPVPSGISLGNWKKLVHYWASSDFQKLSQCGQEARASQVHLHITGGTSYTNKRADYFDEHGKEMTLWELYEDSHMRKDGTFIEGTHTAEFLEDVSAKADMLQQLDSEGKKSRQEIENEAFENVLYGEEIPDRPQGYGFGVRKSSIYGVQGMLRKQGNGKVHKRPVVEVDNDLKAEMAALNKRNEELEKQSQVLQDKFDEHTNLLKSVLELVRNGKASTQVLDAAESALNMTKSR